MAPNAAPKQGLSKKSGLSATSGCGIGSRRAKEPRQIVRSGQDGVSGNFAAAAALLLAAALVLPLILPPALSAQESLKAYQTRFANISYPDEKDLHAFTRNTGSGLSFFRESPERNPLLAKTQVDKMIETVCSLLDMYPPNLHFGIVLHRTQSEVTTAYHKASGGANAYKEQEMTSAAPIAFYSHRVRKIYVAVDTVTEGILAHEIAHAVISAYFVAPPPARMQEILAQYMDKYFRDR